MLFDANLLTLALSELKAVLPARVDDVWEDRRGNILLALRGRATRRTLLLSCDARFYRLHLTGRTGERPRRGSVAQLALYLTGAHLVDAGQPPGDRVALLQLSAHDRLGEPHPLVLVHELFGPGANLTLVDADRRILWSLRPRRRAPGDLFPAWAPAGDPIPAGPVAEGLDPAERERLAAVLTGSQPPTPVKYGQADVPVAAYPLPLWPGGRPAASLSEALDEVYDDLERQAALAEGRRAMARRLHEAIAKVQRRLDKQERELAETAEAERLRLCGELLLAYGWQVPAGATELRAEHWETGEPVVIPLDPGRSPSENAQLYFDRYRRAVRRRERLAPEVEAARRALERLEAMAALVPTADEGTLDVLAQELGRTESAPDREPAQPLPPWRFRTSGGCEVLVGRNQRQNDDLTFRVARSEDIWLHVKDYPGSHVILRSAHPTEADILEACLLAAYFSKARGGTHVAVDFTRRRHVRRQSGAGPGRVLYDHQETRFVSTEDARLAELLKQLPDQEAPR